MKLIYLCLIAAVSEQLTAGSRLQGGVRLIAGLTAARLMLSAAADLPLLLK
jgi:hypothetical protein